MSVPAGLLIFLAILAAAWIAYRVVKYRRERSRPSLGDANAYDGNLSRRARITVRPAARSHTPASMSHMAAGTRHTAECTAAGTPHTVAGTPGLVAGITSR